jgi:Contractile injection system spike tip protein
MGDFVMRTGDLVRITIPPPAVVPAVEGPVPLEGSGGPVTIDGMSVCLLGDELPEILAEPLPYTAPPFTVPGLGTLMLTLMPSNLTVITQKGKPLLIKGEPFTAMFTVTEPAMQPTPAGPVPDPDLEKPGTAEFITTNETVSAS